MRGGKSDRTGCSPTSGWRNGFRRIIRCGRSGRWRMRSLRPERALRGALFAYGTTLDPAGDAAEGDAAAGLLLGALRAAMLMEQIDYNLLFRWFVGLPLDGAVWHATVFTHNRDRLLEAEVAREFLAALLAQPQVKQLLSNDHFSVDGTLIEAWASMKSFRPKDGSGAPPGPGRNGERNFRKEKRSNETPRLDHRSGREALPQGRRPREPAVLHGPRPDGEPQRACGRRRADAGRRDCRAGCSADHGRPSRIGRPHHAGRRQGL